MLRFVIENGMIDIGDIQDNIKAMKREEMLRQQGTGLANITFYTERLFFSIASITNHVRKGNCLTDKKVIKMSDKEKIL